MFVLVYYSPKQEKFITHFTNLNFSKVGEENGLGWVLVQRFRVFENKLFYLENGLGSMITSKKRGKELIKSKLIDFIKSL